MRRLAYGEVLAAVIVLTALATVLTLGIVLGFAACRAGSAHPIEPVASPSVVRQTPGLEVPCRCGTRGPIHG